MAKFFQVENWLDNTLKTLRSNTGRPIIVKNKGYNPIIGLDKNGGYIVTEKTTQNQADLLIGTMLMLL